MTPYEQFKHDGAQEIEAQGRDDTLAQATRTWFDQANAHKYSYHFEWLGRPIIQYPQDMVAMQEIIWSVQPELIIETGIAHGGSLIFYASMLELLASCTGVQGSVLGVDIDIRAHNRTAIEAHPMAKRIRMLQGSSIASDVIAQVEAAAESKSRVLVVLDSNHTHDHVLAELEAYAPLTTVGSYCVVFDTVVEDMAAHLSGHRPWGPGNSPKTATREYLKHHPEFQSDDQIHHRLLITVAPDGYLKRHW